MSASLIDLGYINWQTDARRYYNNKASFSWDGLDAMKFLSDTALSKNYASHLADSLKNIFGLVTPPSSLLWVVAVWLVFNILLVEATKWVSMRWHS